MIIEKTSFHLGSVLKSEKIELAIQANPNLYFFILQCINRHKGNDWGDCKEDNWTKNDNAVINNNNIQSKYKLPTGLKSLTSESKILIISNPTKVSTTILFSSEI